MADLENVKKRREKLAKDVKRGDKAAVAEDEVLAKFEPHPGRRQAGLDRSTHAGGKSRGKGFFLLTDKPTIFACNVKESDLATADQNPFVQKVRDYVKTHLACEAVVISAQIESDLIDLSEAEAKEFLKELGVQRIRRRRVDPRHLSFARPADLFHGGREGGPRVDDSCGRYRAESRRRDSFAISNAVSSRPKPSPTRIWSNAVPSPRRAKRACTAWKARNTSSRTVT